MKISVVIRTLNEERYLGELCSSISRQKFNAPLQDVLVEIVLVDSGSSDRTLQIARDHNCRIEKIHRKDFSFGRSLNLGCEIAKGEILVFVSGHCVPLDDYWLSNLCAPIVNGRAEYAYGRQLGGENSRLSEYQIFAKYYPMESMIPQNGFFCNNANSAILKSSWEKYKFNEEITGLEDMDLAKRLVQNSGKVAYVANSAVYHHHYETWPQVRRRFEREAIALQGILPQVHVSLLDTIRYILASVISDVKIAKERGMLSKNFIEIVLYRYYQYTGVYIGNHQHRRLSRAEKERYFYPM